MKYLVFLFLIIPSLSVFANPNQELETWPEDPVAITPANASNYKLSGYCASGNGDVTIEFGTLTFTTPCNTFFGIYQTYEDVSAEVTTNPIRHCVTQTPFPQRCSKIASNDLAPPGISFFNSTLEIITLNNGNNYPVSGECAPVGAAVSLDIGASTGILTGTCASNNRFYLTGDVSSAADGLDIPVTVTITNGPDTGTDTALVNKISTPDPAPFITAVNLVENDIDADSWLESGDSVDFAITFSETVRADSVVTLDFNLTSGPKTAVYVSGSPSNTITFRMNISNGDDLCSGTLPVTGITQAGDGIMDLEDQLADTSAFPSSFSISGIDAVAPSFGGLFNLASSNANETQSPKFNGPGFNVAENCPNVDVRGSLQEVVSSNIVQAENSIPPADIALGEYRFFDGVDGLSFSLIPDTLHRAIFTAYDQAGNSVTAQSTNWTVSPAGTLPNLILHLTGKVKDSIIDEFGNDSLHGSFTGNIQLLEDVSESAVVHDFTARGTTQRPTYDAVSEEFIFDGVNDCMRTGNHPELNTATVVERSYGLLFRSDTDITTRQTVFEEGAQVRGMNVYIDQGRVYCGFWNQVDDGDGYQAFVSQSISILPDEIYSVAPVFDYTNYAGPAGPDGTFQCYINGMAMGAPIPVTSRLFAHSGDVSMGCNGSRTIQHDGQATTRQYFKGNILELMVFNNPPGDAEAADIYNYLQLTWDL